MSEVRYPWIILAIYLRINASRFRSSSGCLAVHQSTKVLALGRGICSGISTSKLYKDSVMLEQKTHLMNQYLTLEYQIAFAF